MEVDKTAIMEAYMLEHILQDICLIYSQLHTIWKWLVY